MRADLLLKLATLGMADLKRNSYLETLKKLSIEESPMMQIDLELSWIDPIINYLKAETLSTNDLTACKVKRLALHYILIQEKLYKRSHTFPLLKCLPPSKVDYAMREVHEGICGNHLGGRALAYKILR